MNIYTYIYIYIYIYTYKYISTYITGSESGRIWNVQNQLSWAIFICCRKVEGLLQFNLLFLYRRHTTLTFEIVGRVLTHTYTHTHTQTHTRTRTNKIRAHTHTLIHTNTHMPTSMCTEDESPVVTLTRMSQKWYANSIVKFCTLLEIFDWFVRFRENLFSPIQVTGMPTSSLSHKYHVTLFYPSLVFIRQMMDKKKSRTSTHTLIYISTYTTGSESSRIGNFASLLCIYPSNDGYRRITWNLTLNQISREHARNLTVELFDGLWNSTCPFSIHYLINRKQRRGISVRVTPSHTRRDSYEWQQVLTEPHHQWNISGKCTHIILVHPNTDRVVQGILRFLKQFLKHIF